jgi:hypothetical protein
MKTTHVVLGNGKIISNLDWHTKYRFQGHEIVKMGTHGECIHHSKQMAADILASV